MKKGEYLEGLILAAAMAAGLITRGRRTAPQTVVTASEGTKQAEVTASAESQEKEEALAGKIEITLSLNHVDATTHPYRYDSERFAELVSEKTGDRIAVKVYPASQIASGAKVTESTQMGTLGIVLGSTMAAKNFILKIGILNLLFLLENADQVFSVLDGDVGSGLRATAEAKGLKILCWMYNGFRNISSSVRPITVSEDLKKLKIHVPGSQVFLKIFETLGGVPTLMAISEVFTAIRLKIAGGRGNPSTIFVSNKYNEINDHYSVTHHIFAAGPLAMSLDKFSLFSEEDQATLLEVAQEAAEYQRQLTIDSADQKLQQIKDVGINVNIVEDMSDFEVTVQLVYRTFKGKCGTLIEKIQEATKQEEYDFMGNCVLRVIHIVDKFMEVSSALILGGMTPFIFAQVLVRYVFKSLLVRSEEGARFTFIWMTFIVGYVGAREGQHIRVELIQNLFPESIKVGMKVLCDPTSAGFFILVLFYYCARQDKLSTQTSPALRIPMVFVYLGMMLEYFGMAASYSLHIFKMLRKKKGEEAS